MEFCKDKSKQYVCMCVCTYIDKYVFVLAQCLAHGKYCFSLFQVIYPPGTF